MPVLPRFANAYMIIYNGFQDKRLKPRPRCVALGVFDGVHLGHQKILNEIIRTAAKKNWASTVVTFDPDPSRVLRPEKRHPILISLEHRLRFFAKMGIEETLVITFDKKFSKISHKTFLENFLLRHLGMRFLAVGNDFCFGYQGLGNTGYLGEKSRALSFQFHQVSPLRKNGQVVSSTKIRRLVERGKLRKAARMLGRPVSVYGQVIRGRGRGQRTGFPTANLDPHHETLPPSGVYAAWGLWRKKKLKAVVHIGKRPTFSDKEKSLEAHFLNFHKNIYGEEIELFFVKKLRVIKRFKSPKMLAGAIAADMRKALQSLSDQV